MMVVIISAEDLAVEFLPVFKRVAARAQSQKRLAGVEKIFDSIQLLVRQSHPSHEQNNEVGFVKKFKSTNPVRVVAFEIKAIETVAPFQKFPERGQRGRGLIFSFAADEKNCCRLVCSGGKSFGRKTKGQAGKQTKNRRGQFHSALPRSIREQVCHVFRKVGGEQRQRLPLRAHDVRADADDRETLHGLVEKHLAGRALAGGDLRRHRNPVIAHGDDVARLKTQLVPAVARDFSGHNNIAVVMRSEAKSVVVLQTFPQLRGDGVGQARFQRFIVERGNLDGAAARSFASRRAKPVARATAEVQQQQTRQETQHVICPLPWRIQAFV